MKIFFIVIVYIACHFWYYVVKARNIGIFRTERMIFLFHFLSFLLLGVFGYFIAKYSQEKIMPFVLGALAIHGIYSLSFLELWSLSQGGYSLSILRTTPINRDCKLNTLDKLVIIGNNKFSERVSSLKGLKLIQQKEDILSATRLGKCITVIFLIIIKITNVHDRG